MPKWHHKRHIPQEHQVGPDRPAHPTLLHKPPAPDLTFGCPHLAVLALQEQDREQLLTAQEDAHLVRLQFQRLLQDYRAVEGTLVELRRQVRDLHEEVDRLEGRLDLQQKIAQQVQPPLRVAG